MTVNWFTVFMTAFYPLMIVSAVAYLSLMAFQRRKNMNKMMENVSGKLAINVIISAKDVVHIGRGFKLSPKDSADVIYKLYAEDHDSSSYEALKTLAADIEKEEAFDELPDEVKPSLSRIGKLIDNTNEPSDKHILLPITTTLLKYVDLKAEQEKVKKQTNRAYAITIISFIVGASSFYFTLKSPSEGDIRKAMEQVLIERQINDSVRK